jgi:elongation factor P hydroxylase
MHAVTSKPDQRTHNVLAALPAVHWEAGVADLIRCLNPWLERDWQTQLVAGVSEPVYWPASSPGGLHRIVFAHGYFNSALHELAHWCLAGAQRRLREDYGYWYCPDGRSAEQQAAFEQVEVKPQALEWWLALATDRSFRTSTDNLNGIGTDDRPFRCVVQQQAQRYRAQGLPTRAQSAVKLLSDNFARPWPSTRCFTNLPR